MKDMNSTLNEIRDLRSRGTLLINSEQYNRWTKGQDMLRRADDLADEIARDFDLWLSENGYHADDDAPDAFPVYCEENGLDEEAATALYEALR